MTQETTFTPKPEPQFGELTFPKYMFNPTNGSIIVATSDGKGVVMDKGSASTLPEIINNTQGYEDAIGEIKSVQEYPVVG